MQKADSNRVWSGMPIKVRGDVQAFFAASTYVEVGDGTSTLFWLDRWIGGRAVAALAPALISLIPRRALRSRMVADGLFGRRWVRDIAGGLSVQAIVECIRLWDALESVRLSALPDTIVCRWAADGQYSAERCFLCDSENKVACNTTLNSTLNS